MLREILIGLAVLTSLTINNVVAKRLTNKTVYLSVLPMAGYEKYYQDVSLLHLERVTSLIFKNEKGPVKWTTCETLFSHPVMLDLQNADHVDPLNKQVLEDVQTKHPNLYARYYKPPDVRVMNQVLPQFLNSYRKYNFTIGGVIVPEYAFPCFTRNRATSNIEVYLVTLEYSLPRTDDSDEEEYVKKVGSRFVFHRNEDTNETTLIAMVDRASDQVIPPHPNYWDRPELNQERRSKELCELNEFQHMRLCASLFNSQNWTKVVQYVAPYIAASECTESELFLQCPDGNANFTDVVLECQAKRIGGDSNRPAIYYISRGLRPHQFFVFAPRENDPVPEMINSYYSYLFKMTYLKSIWPGFAT